MMAGLATRLCRLLPPARAATRLFSDRRTGRIAETSVFIQSGHRISELPVVVKKVRSVWELTSKLGIDTGTPVVQQDNPSLALPKDLNEEETEIISGFGNCYNSSSIFRLLETIPTAEVTPAVASYAYKKIVELETVYEAGRGGGGAAVPRGRADQPTSFARAAFISLLVDIICKGRQPAALLSGLASVLRDSHSAEQERYKAQVLEELLICVSDGAFPLRDICQAIHILSSFYQDSKRCREVADKLWFGIVDQGRQMSNDDLVAVFSTLPHLNKSRKVIMRVLEEKSVDCWQTFHTSHVVEILRVLQGLQYDRTGRGFMQMVSRWLAVNIHQVTERELLAVVYSLRHLEYTDRAVITALEKVMKLRGCRIQEPDLIATVSSYCALLRIRSPTILEGIGQYYIEHHRTLSIPQITAMAGTFGQLDFHPPNGFKFWELLESALDMKFNQFQPIDIINILVSFLYIEKFPMNFTSKLFNPFFLDRLHGQTEDLVTASRLQLKLFDTAMVLECRGYEGPFLPKETAARRIQSDSRVLRCAGRLAAPLAELVGGSDRVGLSTTLASLPLHPLYVVDMMIYKSQAATLLRFGIHTNNSGNVAVVILAPEHYDRSGQQLVGSQAMRVRQLTMLGFRVMQVNMMKANKLMMHPVKLKEYLQELYSKVK